MLMLIRHLLLAAVLTALPATPAAADSAHRPSREGSDTALVDRFETLRVGPGQTWGWQSSAYSRCTDNLANPDAWKLDHLTTSAMSTERGYLTITATPRSDGMWGTGLLTTGDSCGSGGDGTMVRTGDLLLAHVLLPAEGSGAWPALWTWKDGHNEVDVFEWHGDDTHSLEFVNHVRDGEGFWFTDPAVDANRWLYIGARFGVDDITWYVGDTPGQLAAVHSDHKGVGPDFAAYPVLNLSINDGHWHQAPTTGDPVTLGVDLLVVQHPAPDDLPQAPEGPAPQTQSAPRSGAHSFGQAGELARW